MKKIYVLSGVAFFMCCLLNFTYAQEAANELVGYWSFDETSGVLVEDDSKYDNHGEVKETTAHEWVEGVMNNAINLSAASLNTHIRVPHADQIAFNDHSFSISFWMNLPELVDRQAYIFHKGTFRTRSTSHWYGLDIKEDEMRFSVDDNVTKSVVRTPNAEFITGEWVHVVVMRNKESGTLRIYRNGELEVEAADNTKEGIAKAEPLAIGNSTDYNMPYKGMLDEFKMFNYSLSQEEITALYNKERLGEPVGLKAVNPSPAHETTGVRVNNALVLSWDSDGDLYNLYLGTSPDNLELKASGISEKNYSVSGLSGETTYFWRVDAIAQDPVEEDEEAVGEVWSFTTSSITGFADLASAGVKVYPNPAADKLILSNASKLELVQVYNVQGQLVKSIGSDNNNEIQIQVADLKRGLYLLKAVQKDGSILQGKFIK